MNRKTLDFLADPIFLILGWIGIVIICEILKIEDPKWIEGGVAIMLIIIYFVANDERRKLMTEQEKREEDRFNEPHGPA